MKRRLFWKILFGFWLTTIIITQGIWLLFAFLRPIQQPQVEPLNGMARVALSAATSAIQLGGTAALQAQMASWPPDVRSRIQVHEDAAPTASPAAKDVTDPQGQRYQVVYNNPGPRTRDRDHDHDRDRGPFGIPMEVWIVSIIGGLLFSATLAWYLTNPIRSMRIGFGRLAQGDFATRLGPAMGRRRDEIADLAHDFDRMAERLEELVSARDRLMAGVSHELRSPLARLQLAIGLARQDPSKLETSLQRIDREAKRLDEMVGEILVLSKLESGAPQPEEYFDVAEIMRGVAEDAKFEAAPRGIEVTAETDPPQEKMEWICLGSGKLIAHAFENIVRNALRFSRAGQQVKLRLTASRDGTFNFTVTDQGPGVPTEALATLFQPFVQVSPGDGQGFGLGLAIAQRAILAHGGSISAHNGFGGGLVVSATLPAANMEASLPA
jgi:two-component system OmpR family sensor kinase